MLCGAGDTLSTENDAKDIKKMFSYERLPLGLSIFRCQFLSRHIIFAVSTFEMN